MWDLIVSVPDHCLSFYFKTWHKFSTEICFMLIPIIVLSIAHKFITGKF